MRLVWERTMIVPNRISIIWPYWMRGEAMLRGLASMHEHYIHDDVEIVIVDDGSPEDKAVNALRSQGTWVGNWGDRIKLVELPIKQVPMNPCVPINRGVAASTGEYVLLTNPETTHRTPILAAMRETIGRLGPKTYVHAAVWCPESGSWHTHSQHASAAYHFAGLMRRDLFDAAGGFDEEYREGHCFDDPDFVQRALRAGAKFVFRDDLVADHRQDLGAKHSMPRELWDRNHALFWKKWPNPTCIDGTAMTYERLQNWPDQVRS